MTSTWHPCPHCNTFCSAEQWSQQGAPCPACGQPLTTALPPPPRPAQLALDLLSRHEALAAAQVVPEAALCVQCGMCSYNCPMGIDVRAHAWRGRSIHDSHCLTCGECVNRCPRGVLRFERLPLFTAR